MSTNVKEVQPGRQVNIRLQTTPNSLVGVLGVDQGVLKLKSGNDIILSEVCYAISYCLKASCNFYFKMFIPLLKKM